MASVQNLKQWHESVRSRTRWEDWRSENILSGFFPNEIKSLKLMDDLVRLPGEDALLNLLAGWRGEASQQEVIQERLRRIESMPFNDVRPEIIEALSRRFTGLVKYESVYRRPLTPERLQSSFTEREWQLIRNFDATHRADREASLEDLLIDRRDEAALMLCLQAFADYKPDHCNEGLRDALCFKLRCFLVRPDVDTTDPTLDTLKISASGKYVEHVENPLYLLTGNDVTDLPVSETEWMRRVSRRFGLWREDSQTPYWSASAESRGNADALLSGVGMVPLRDRRSEFTHAMGWSNRHLLYRASIGTDAVFLKPFSGNKAFPGAADFTGIWQRHSPLRSMGHLSALVMQGMSGQGIYRLDLNAGGKAEMTVINAMRPLALISAMRFAGMQ